MAFLSPEYKAVSELCKTFIILLSAANVPCSRSLLTFFIQPHCVRNTVYNHCGVINTADSCKLYLSPTYPFLKRLAYEKALDGVGNGTALVAAE